MKIGAFARTVLALSGFWMVGNGVYGMALEPKVPVASGEVNLLVKNSQNQGALLIGFGGALVALSAVGKDPVGAVCDKVEASGIWLTETVTGKPDGTN